MGPRVLAAVVFANGDGFLPSDAADNRIDGREVCYGSAIAAELVLKAYLLAKGWSDDRCRRDIRHDLEQALASARAAGLDAASPDLVGVIRSEEHTSELQSLMRISYAVFCLKKKNTQK